MGAANSLIKIIATGAKEVGPRLATGVLVSYTGSQAMVNIQGQNLTLPMLDSVSTSIAVGSTVLCQVSKSGGFVIGSLNTVSRTTSGVWTGGFSNPAVPRPSSGGLRYTNVSPNQTGAYDDNSGLWSTTGSTFTQSSTTGGAWFYGSTAFSSLAGKSLVSLEIYLPTLTSGSYPLNVGYLLRATRPTGIAGFNPSTAARSASGWVPLPSTFVTALSGSLNAFAVGIATSTTTAVIGNAAPYGTLRIGWSN